MSSWLTETESLVYSGRIKVPYQWWVGETGSRFLAALRDERKILGRYCPECNLVFVPPRKTCGRCFCQELEWREVGHSGSLVTYTIPRYESDLHPLKGPFAYGVIKLDGADTGLTHLLGEFAEGELRSGLRVEAVFAEERRGHILDLAYFRPEK